MLVLYFLPAFSGLTFMDKTSLLLTFSIAVFAAIEGYATFKRAEMELNRHRISDARNELEKAYGPLYTLLNKTKPSSTEEDAFWLDYEEREKVDAIFATYPFMFSAEINSLWQEKIRNYKTIIQKCWSLKDYTTLGIPTLTEYFGNKALEKPIFDKIVLRARDILNNNSKILMDWVRKNSEILDCTPPKAGATAFIKYNADLSSTTFCSGLLEKQGILVAPGDVFKVPKHFRMKYGGSDGSILSDILVHFDKFLKEIQNKPREKQIS